MFDTLVLIQDVTFSAGADLVNSGRPVQEFEAGALIVSEGEDTQDLVMLILSNGFCDTYRT